MASTSQTYNNREAGETRAGNWMQTYSGVQFWPLDPHHSEIMIIDIGHALSNMCRYAGHSKKFYSVAEHSVLVSQIVPPEHAFAALMHDATEAYLVDVPRPIKQYLGGYHDYEDRLWKEICKAYMIDVDLPDCVKEADNAVLLAEGEQIMGPKPAPWNIPGEPAAVTIEFWPPELAKVTFLTRFVELNAQRFN